jgi:cytochrome c-type biogenesis protein CcmH
MFWFVALPLAVLAALFVISPLLRPGRVGNVGSANDAEVYRDQLAEVERDARSGLLEAPEAAQARAEIARRLIAASEGQPAKTSAASGRKTAFGIAAFLCLSIPLVGVYFYDRIGRPSEVDQPLAERMASADPDINILIAKAEAHLEANPRDGKGWEVLAPIYMRQMRAADAAGAWKNVIDILGPSAERYSNYGEALAADKGGQVAEDAQGAFKKALALDPADPRSRFYLALADAQTGKFEEALDAFNALLRDSPPDAPWVDIVRMQVARITDAKINKDKAPGNPEAADIEAAAGLNDQDRAQMIRTMVETLDARLKDDPANFEGWQRLIRSYVVLNDRDKAIDALKRGLAAFPPDSDNGKALLSLAKEVGLPTEDAVQ